MLKSVKWNAAGVSKKFADLVCRDFDLTRCRSSRNARLPCYSPLH